MPSSIAYDKAYRRLFDRLDWLSERLEGQRHLVGDTMPVLCGRPFGDGTPPGPPPQDERVVADHNPLPPFD